MRKYIFILLIIFTVGSTTFGAPTKKLSQLKFEEDTDFNGTRLSDALALMSKVTKVTIVADSEVKDVIIDLYINKGQSLREVLDIIEVTNNLEEIYIDKIVMLTKTGKGSTTLIGKIVGESDQGLADTRVTLVDSEYKTIKTEAGGIFIYDNIRPGIYIIKLEKDGYATSSEVVDIKQNKTTNINIILDKKNKEGLVVVKEEEGLREKNLGSSKNNEGTEIVTERIELKHAYAEDIKGMIESISGGNLKVSAFSKLHMLVLKGDKTDIGIAKKLIEDMDRPVKQVRITAQVLDTTDNLFEDLGFDWLFSNTDSSISSNSVDTDGVSTEGTTSSFSSSTGAGVLSFLDLFNDADNLINLSINILQQTEELNVSSVPSVVVVNGEEAEFNVTEEVIVGTETDTDDDGNETETPIWEEAGTLFSVTPTIREGGDDPDTIILEISSEVSDFKLTSGYDGDSGAKLASTITTKVQVQDGEVLFIGGLKKTTVKETIYKVPILGDIPVLQTLFRSTSTTNDVRQIYIQITAEIVDQENSNKEIDLNSFRKNPATTGKLKRIYPDFEKPEEEGISL